MQLTPAYGYGPSPRDLDGRASDKAPARTGTSCGLKVGIGIPLIFVEFFDLEKSRKFEVSMRLHYIRVFQTA